MTDVDLVHSADDFERFLEDHYDSIFAFAWRVMGSREDAEDLTQDVCLSLPRKLLGFRGDCKPKTWLYRIVTNAAIDALRKKKRSARVVEEHSLELHNMVEEGRERAERYSWLRQAISELPDDLRITAALLVEQGLSQAEAAECLDIAPGTISWRMSEIKKMLQNYARENSDVA